MKHRKPSPISVAGVTAPAVRPTRLGAALFATFATFPILVTILLMDLILL